MIRGPHYKGEMLRGPQFNGGKLLRATKDLETLKLTEFLRCARAAQTYLAGRVFETPAQEDDEKVRIWICHGLACQGSIL